MILNVRFTANKLALIYLVLLHLITAQAQTDPAETQEPPGTVESPDTVGDENPVPQLVQSEDQEPTSNLWFKYWPKYSLKDIVRENIAYKEKGGHLDCEISGDELTFFTCAFDQQTDQSDGSDSYLTEEDLSANHEQTITIADSRSLFNR